MMFRYLTVLARLGYDLVAMQSLLPPRYLDTHGDSRATAHQDSILTTLLERQSFAASPNSGLRTQRLWQESFSDTSQRWNYRSDKNPRAPELKHNVTNEALRLNDCCNAPWGKDMIGKGESRSKRRHGPSNDLGLIKSVNSVRSKAQKLLDNSSWEMLSLEEALTSLEQMPQLRSVANVKCILQKCRKQKNLTHAKRLYAYMCKSRLETHRSLGNYLVPMLVECGSVCDALQVFNRLVDPNAYSYTSLITAYIDCGASQLAFNLYQKMQETSVDASRFTFLSLLRACTKLKHAERGRGIQADIARTGLESDLFLGATLVDLYAKCGWLTKAREVFDKLAARDIVLWGALIAGYAQQGLSEEALNCFEQMQLEGVPPDAGTFVCSLKACGSVRAREKGQEIHAEIVRKGLENYPFVGNTLVDMYAKCCWLGKAREVFDKLPVRTVVSWNVIIAGYAQLGLGDEALNCYEQMQLLEDVCPDAVTFVCILTACGSIGAIGKGQEIHAEIARKGLAIHPVVGSSLVDMYAKCGWLPKAREVFDELPVRDVVSWNTLIAGYAQHGHGVEALNCFEKMQRESMSPDGTTFVCSLMACGSIGAIDKGREIHTEIVRKGLESHPFLGNALVDMYAKCGWLTEAGEIFDKLGVRDVVSWSAIIAGYTQLGQSEIVFRTLEKMVGEGIEPDGVCFLSVLTVCSHGGLLEKGQWYWEAMVKDYHVSPTIEHYTCMIDLLGRAGHLNEAVAMVEKMPFQPDRAVWLTVLGACQKWGNVMLGRQAFEHALRFDKKEPAAYVLMSNIYADAQMLEAKEEVEAMREMANTLHGRSQEGVQLNLNELCLPL